MWVETILERGSQRVSEKYGTKEFLEDSVDYTLEMHGIHAGGMRLQTQGPDEQPVFMPSVGKFSEISERRTLSTAAVTGESQVAKGPSCLRAGAPPPDS